MSQIKAAPSLMSRPLPAPPVVCPALVNVRVRGLWSHGHFPSRSRISCTELSSGGSGKDLGASEYSDQACDENAAAGDDEGDSLGWSKDEIDAISALFDRPMRQKPLKPPNPAKQRALPLPLPHKTRLPVAPAPKQHLRLAARAALSSRASFSDQVRKNPEALVGIAREIATLPPERDVSAVLDRWARFLRKGSLSMTIRELGHMGLPERALQTLCWAQRQTVVPLFPDDRILASTIQVLARFGQLKVESALEQCVPTASRTVLEAMASGFIRDGKLGLARKLLELAKINQRTLHPSIYVKLMLEAARTPEGYGLAAALVDELGESPDLDLRPQDCTAVMKVCVKLRRYAAVESLFSWFRDSGGSPTVVMYTTVVHSRCRDGRHREALALVWDMEQAGCLLDLPAYRVIVKLCVVLRDQERALWYLSRLKEAGFVPTGDMYRNVIEGYAAEGRLAKCRQLIREAESAGVKLDRRLLSRLPESSDGRSS
ncbi:pentatricopeptide repeat-containing protein At2g01860 [Phragmites australis]|uniref:pentatricopeptide repeat-containing protein At2g01860 n=1 Tax=Phragmites australis TaxID=29695 RepID=UPI002D7919A0|nr:pentatricopeptide repeat-containing protein At2g01860 [Phragmites australis]